jgi:5-methylcytosine-specific restriction endonuclease McrBC regulatory subunit McrC
MRTVRGRIAVMRQLGKLANRPDLVACTFDELAVDNVWNQVLKRAIRTTRPWIRSGELNRQWVELMGVLDGVDVVVERNRCHAAVVQPTGRTLPGSYRLGALDPGLAGAGVTCRP